MNTCKYMHFRNPITKHDEEWGLDDVVGIDSKGGATVAYTEQDGKLFAAVAYCNPTDNFQYRYGRNKAAGRLQQLLAKPELNDSDKYFVLDSDGLAELHRFMVDDLGYFHRGPRK